MPKLWEKAKPFGRPRKFAKGETLWKECVKYFEWCEANPLVEEKLFAYQGDVTRDSVNRMRAMTMGGLFVFLNIDESTWRTWKDPEHDFFRICKVVEKIIYEQKLTGAAADQLNAAIIARELGLKEQTSTEVTSPDGSMSPNRELSDDELRKELAARGLPENLLEE